MKRVESFCHKIFMSKFCEILVEYRCINFLRSADPIAYIPFICKYSRHDESRGAYSIRLIDIIIRFILKSLGGSTGNNLLPDEFDLGNSFAQLCVELSKCDI